jgi:putative oxidoreductase
MSIRHIDLDPKTISRIPAMQHGRGLRMLRTYESIDSKVVRTLDAWAPTVLRYALAVVFIWFGALKVIGRSPVYELVADTVPFLPGDLVVPAFGVLEVVIGIGLLLGIGLRVVLLFLVLQMLGTFLVWVTQPGESFQDGNPLLLTTAGEFVLKNLVLIAAAMVVGGKLREGRAP